MADQESTRDVCFVGGTPTLGAAGVRAWAHELAKRNDALLDVPVLLLNAFAARLEADERFDGLQQVDTRQSMNTVADYALIEQGRREVYAEIAASTDDPRADHGDRYRCLFCGEGDERAHKPDCLWLRARATAATEPGR